MEDKINIKITEVTDPWNFHAVEILNGNGSQKSPEAFEFLQMQSAMSNYMENMMEEGVAPHRPLEGEICAVKYREEGLWCRVKVKSLQKNERSQYAMCFGLDDGREFTCPLLRMYKLPQKFREHPSRVKHFRLWGIQPATLTVQEADSETGIVVEKRPCNKWDPSACTVMRKMIDESTGCQAEVVEKTPNNTLYVNLYLTTPGGSVFLNKYLVNGKYAVYCENRGPISSGGEQEEAAKTVHNETCSKTQAPSSSEAMPALVPTDENISDVEESQVTDPVKDFFHSFQSVTMSPPLPLLLKASPEKLVYASDLEDEQLSPERRNLDHDSSTNVSKNLCRSPTKGDSIRLKELSSIEANTDYDRRKQASPGRPGGSLLQKLCQNSIGRGRGLVHANFSGRGSSSPSSGSANTSPLKSFSAISPQNIFSINSPQKNISTDIKGIGRGAFIQEKSGLLSPSKRTPQSKMDGDIGSQQSYASNNSASFTRSNRNGYEHVTVLSEKDLPDLDVKDSEVLTGLPKLIPSSTSPLKSPKNPSFSEKSDSIKIDQIVKSKSREIIENISEELEMDQIKATSNGSPMKSLKKTEAYSSEAYQINSTFSDDGSTSSSSATGVGRRTRYRGGLDPMMEKKSKEKCDEQRNSKDKYAAKMEGKKVLDLLKSKSRQAQYESESFSIGSSAYVADMCFGVAVYGKAIPTYQCNLTGLNFHESVVKVLQDTFEIENLIEMEGYLWPALMMCRHVVAVSPENLKRGSELACELRCKMAYVPAVLSHLYDKMKYTELAPGKGPLAVIVVSSWKKARGVYDIIERFIGSGPKTMQRLKCIVLYAAGTEDQESTRFQLFRGCEILVSTPNSLLRMVKEETTSLRRLCHMVLDDADILAEKFPNEIDEIMQTYGVILKDRMDEQEVPKQIAIFAGRWTPGVDHFRQRYTQEAIIVFNSRSEAAVYGGVKQVVIPTKETNHLSVFCGLIDSFSSTESRVIVFTEEVEKAMELLKAVKSRGIYCLLIHGKQTSDAVEEARTQWLQVTRSKQLVVMVCTDECWRELEVTNATAVIHYEVPRSKTRLGNRLACMMDHFLDRTKTKVHDIEPVSHIILTDQNASRIEMLHRVLSRFKTEKPQWLTDFIQKHRMILDQDAEKPLCRLLKAFGECSMKDRCEFRHVLIPEVDLKTGETTVNHLPSSGQVKVSVIHVKDTSFYYGHLLEHTSIKDQVKTDLRSVYQGLFLDIQFYYSKEENQKPHIPSSDPSKDGLCMFRDNRGDLYRAKVVNTWEGRHIRECKVRLVDYGHSDVGGIDQLMRLPEHLAKVPYQAVEIFLCRVKPADMDFEWTDMANMFVHEMVEKKFFRGNIVLRLGNTLWLDPLVHQVYDKQVGWTNDFIIRERLLTNKFAMANPEHIQHLYEFCRGKTDIPEHIMRKYFDYCIEMELMQETLSTSTDQHEVNIACIEDPGLFYLMKYNTMDQLEALESAIEERMNKSGEDKEKTKVDTEMDIEKGSVCLAKFSHQWYRGKIISDEVEGKWEVFSLDYGDTEWVPSSDVRPLPRDLSELPCQAIECSLAHIKPPGEEWPSDAVEAMCDMAYYVDNMKKLLYAKVLGRKESCHTMGQQLVVELTKTDGGQVVSMAEELVRRHFAQGDVGEDDKVPLQPLFGKPALKNQKFFNILDKIPFLCANLYWCQEEEEALKQAEELRDILSDRNDGWDLSIESRGVLDSLIKTLGYLTSVQAHSVLLSALVDCCVQSQRLCEAAVTKHHLVHRLHSCLEQVSHPDIQLQAAQAFKRLTLQPCFHEAASRSPLVKTITFFFAAHQSSSPLDLQLLNCLCNVAAHLMIQSEDQSDIDDLISLETLDLVMNNLKACTLDQSCEPWLEYLAAASNIPSTHNFLVREKTISVLISYLQEKDSNKCIFYILNIFKEVAEASKKHKHILFEQELLVVLKRLQTSGHLGSGSSEMCEELIKIMHYQFPGKEELAGVLAQPNGIHEQTVCPQVTWTENCFRVLLTVKIPMASHDDFHINNNSLHINSSHQGINYQLNWELFDTILANESRVQPFASHTIVNLRKETKGKWGRLLRQKTKHPCLTFDFEKLYDSEEEEEIDEAINLTQLAQAKVRFSEVDRTPRPILCGSDENSDDDLMYNSDDSDNREPPIDMEALLKSEKKSL